MKILLLNSHSPFIYGGAEILVDSLLRHLRLRGHTVDLIKIPDRWSKHYFLEGILQAKLIPLYDKLYEADLLITFKFPSYHVEHPGKIVWFLHHFKFFYDLWDERGKSFEDLALRKEVITLDTKALASAKKIFAQSKTVAKRLEIYNGVSSEILYPPLNDEIPYKTAEPENYIFYPSRLGPSKRQHLAIKAMKYVKSPVKLILTGQPESEDIKREILALIERLELKDKVIYLGEISREELLNLYSKALGVIFIPQNEDYGFITLEAMASAKPVITCHDSGGPLEFIDHGENGLIVEPVATSLAEAIERLCGNRKEAMEMGNRALEKYQSLNISWDTTISRLLS